MRVTFFGSAPERFVAALDSRTLARVLRTIDLLERFENRLGMPHSKNIGLRLFELRIFGRLEIRLLYTFHKGCAVILHGFVKKSRRMPPKELKIAERCLKMLDAL
ncbi:type II toxin-antitoxin system RelE/ParE family toxin [Candidatus Uhrbacteria bacterium]|nr:type II toxin-antitoxin system RelE/ParE family toxin [Candidatus Uhrbacteria bacterium]